MIPADHDTYIDPNIQLYIHGKLTKADGTDLELSDHTCVTNKLLHSLFSQRNITINGVTITHAADVYHYRSYLKTFLTYGSDAGTPHLTNAFWYHDTGDMGPCNTTAAVTIATNKVFITRWDRIQQSKGVEMVGRLHSDI